MGDVLAYHGPQEEQGRGSLHAHFSIWLVSHAFSEFLRKVLAHAGEPAALENLVQEWLEQTKAKVSSMQFESVGELPGFLGIGGVRRGAEVPPESGDLEGEHPEEAAGPQPPGQAFTADRGNLGCSANGSGSCGGPGARGIKCACDGSCGTLRL